MPIEHCKNDIQNVVKAYFMLYASIFLLGSAIEIIREPDDGNDSLINPTRGQDCG